LNNRKYSIYGTT